MAVSNVRATRPEREATASDFAESASLSEFQDISARIKCLAVGEIDRGIQDWEGPISSRRQWAAVTRKEG